MSKQAHRSLYFKLVIVFFLTMCLLYIAVRSVFSWAMGTAQGDLQRRTEDHLKNYSTRLVSDCLLLDRLQPNWLFDRSVLLKISQPDQVVTPAVRFDLYQQLKSRSGLLMTGADVSGIYMYFPNGQHLLSVFSDKHLPDKRVFIERLDQFIPSRRSKLVFIQNRLYFINAYTASTQTYQDNYTFLIAFELALNKAFASCESNECILLSDENNQLLYATGHHAQEFSQRFPFADSNISMNGSFYSVSSRSLLDGQLNLYCLSSGEMERLKTINNILSISLLTSCLMVGVLFWLSINTHVRKPLNVISNAFRKVELHQEWPTIELHSSRDMEEIAERFNAMVVAQQTLTTHKETAELLMKQSELRLLQSQINPHFLYNCFFMMNSMIELGSYDELSMMTDNLGKYFKYIFVNEAGMKTLMEEVEHATAYANIQLMRFMDRITVDIPEVPESWRNEEIPAIVLQPLIENAFLHGFGKTSQFGRLWIEFAPDATDQRLNIRVSNDVVSVSDEEIKRLMQGLQDRSLKSALANIQQRLLLVYQEGLTFSNMNGTGFSVMFSITRKEKETHAVQSADRR